MMSRSGASACPARLNAVEHPHAAPANEAVVKGLMGAILFRRVVPAKPVLDDEHDPAHYPMVIDTRHAVRKRKIRFDALKLSPAEPEQIGHGRPSCQALESDL